MPLTIFDQDLSTFPLKYFKLMGYIQPSDENMAVCEFGCDSFLPDFEHPARLAKISLLKGTAIQHNLPKKSLKTIDIVGWFRNRASKDVLYRLYHSNLPEQGAPYPTDYLLMRRDYLILETPDTMQYQVRFATTPSELKPARGLRGRLIYPVTMRFFYVDTAVDAFL